VFEIQPSYPYFRGATEVTYNGQPLQQATSQDELEALGSGWFIDANVAVIKVGPGKHE
jgi:hypothetical protein